MGISFAGSARFVPFAAVLALFLSFHPADARAQEEESASPLADLAGSLGIGSSPQGVALSGFVSLPAGPGEVALRIANAGFGDGSASDMGLLYGFRAATGGGRLWARAAAGPAWSTWTVEGDPYNCRNEGVWPFVFEVCDRDWINEHGVALAFQLDGVWEVGGSWGLGATWFSSTGGPRGFNGWSVNFFWYPFGRGPAPTPLG